MRSTEDKKIDNATHLLSILTPQPDSKKAFPKYLTSANCATSLLLQQHSHCCSHAALALLAVWFVGIDTLPPSILALLSASLHCRSGAVSWPSRVVVSVVQAVDLCPRCRGISHPGFLAQCRGGLAKSALQAIQKFPIYTAPLRLMAKWSHLFVRTLLVRISTFSASGTGTERLDGASAVRGPV